MRATTVYDDISLLEVEQEGLDELVDRRSRADHDEDLSRSLQFSAEFHDGRRTFDIGIFGESE